MKKILEMFVLLCLSMPLITSCAINKLKPIIDENQIKYEQPNIIGDWFITSITNNDSLFSTPANTEYLETLDNIKVSFNKFGEFEWIAYEIKDKIVNIKDYSSGRYLIHYNFKENKLKMIDDRYKNNEKKHIIGNIELKYNKLTIITNDGFIFKFNRI